MWECLDIVCCAFYSPLLGKGAQHLVSQLFYPHPTALALPCRLSPTPFKLGLVSIIAWARRTENVPASYPSPQCSQDPKSTLVVKPGLTHHRISWNIWYSPLFIEQLIITTMANIYWVVLYARRCSKCFTCITLFKFSEGRYHTHYSHVTSKYTEAQRRLNNPPKFT